jgi:thiamine biosynthesis lipoprotein
MNKKNILQVLLLIIVIVVAATLHFNKKYSVTKQEFLLDTIVEITAVSKNENVDKIIDDAFNLMKELEIKYSYHQQNSELQKINQVSEIEIDGELYEILQAAETIYFQSDELYDVSIGALTDLWDFENGIIPTPNELKNANYGFEKISLSATKLTKPSNLKINLGSIAKGFIVDEVVQYLQTNGVLSGIVNGGGDMRIFGKSKAIKIGIQHPRKAQNEIISILNIQNSAIVTSGDYERFFMQDGKRYHHILNPKTGFPADNAVSVTVISANAMLADAYSTALFLMPNVDAMKLVEKTKDLECIIFYESNGVLQNVQSSGMKKYILEF